ncbi:MAG: hypothetical protein HKN26_10485 [Acidimicrobiales bacterium]|nr:hypothetical protein [Acidimicrobiales bacterium]
MSDSDPEGTVQEAEPGQPAESGQDAEAGDVRASLDDAASSVWSRIFYPRDWLRLVREHVGGVAQVALAVLIPAYLASWMLGEAIDRAMESDKDRESLIDRLTTIDEWADRLRGVALTVLVIAAVVYAIVWTVDRNRRAAT